MSDLDEFIESKMSFLKLGDGESFVGYYRGAEKVVRNRFGNPAICYKLQPLNSQKTIDWETGAFKVAFDMRKFKEGDCVKITRKGTEKLTTYTIEPAVPF